MLRCNRGNRILDVVYKLKNFSNDFSNLSKNYFIFYDKKNFLCDRLQILIMTLIKQCILRRTFKIQ